MTGCAHKEGCPHLWTPEEDAQLLELLESGLSRAKAALILGRTRKAVTYRCNNVLNVPKVKRPWTPEEDAYVASHALSTPHKDIGAHLGRSWQSVAQRAMHVGAVRENLLAENHPRWKGGYKGHYGWNWYSEIRPAILERDGYRCQHPGCAAFLPSGDGLHVHHIIPWNLTQDDSQNNLVTLCQPHHVAQEAHRWEDYTPDMVSLLPSYQQEIMGVFV